MRNSQRDAISRAHRGYRGEALVLLALTVERIGVVETSDEAEVIEADAEARAGRPRVNGDPQ